jgi:hypothetical protein
MRAIVDIGRALSASPAAGRARITRFVRRRLRSALLIRSRARTAVIAAVALAAVSSLGYWGLRAYGERALRAAVTVLVTDASVRLRAALEGEAGAQTTDPEAAARALEQRAGEVDAGVAALQRLRAAPDRALVTDADVYLVTARELLRRTASIQRYRAAFAASTQTLRNLAATVDRRSGAWIGQAVAAKERAERDYADYRRAVDAAASLLDSLAEPRARLARRIDPASLIEEGRRAQAAERARTAGKRAAEELEQARRLAARA